ncbi:N-acetylmuramoyl-L-alanine amidase [Clostridium sp. Cult2]|uniref:N-acetylmuramoyl-L-alanine amidase n=1 Tax=Clostridium sp. Cult2 TaxID=2079003 RepID=UPI001F01324F|nr:N-acetylmuramoyl-L-alanine amidase [Clostridium sp. Cult2]MCF6466331.1 N-acetylmuramoyl-L-alanine amidase [Clostridium sp. Cult2]
MSKACFDYGHGGKDPGAVGNGLREKDLTLAIGKKVKAIVEKHGVKVVETRSNDKYLSLTERANISNRNNVDIFVSFHINSATNVNARGFEIWTTVGQTQGDIIATAIGKQLMEDFPHVPFRTDYSDGDLDKERNFTVIAKTKAPACLIEIGFIINKIDAQMLKTEQDKIAESISKGILKYLGIAYDKNKVKVRIKGKLYHFDGVKQDNTNYVAIRQVAEALGYKVDWDNTKKEVLINLRK